MRLVSLTLFAVLLAAVLVLVAGRESSARHAAGPSDGAPRPVAAPHAAAYPVSPWQPATRAQALVPDEPLSTAVAVVEPPGSSTPARVVEPPDGGAGSQELVAGWGPPPAPELDPRPFSEAHWQGLEVIPKTPNLARALRLPDEIGGVVVDDVSLPADLQEFRAGDLVTAVDGAPTPNLLAFIRAADRVRDQREVALDVWRRDGAVRLILSALFERLGSANGETATMIPPAARSPHRYQGPCTDCHRIGTNGTLATDQGDPAVGLPPAVSAVNAPPHRNRGPCSSCHKMLP